MGAGEPVPLGAGEATLKYHPWRALALTLLCYPDRGQRLVGSLTGAVASQKVTEASQGSLGRVGNPAYERKSTRELDCEADKPSRGESRAK